MTLQPKIVYRCTINKYYAPDTSGYNKTRHRQGHYISAECAMEAIAQMRKSFPYEVEQGFTVEYWEGRQTPENLEFLKNAPKPTRLDLVREWVKSEEGQPLIFAIEHYLAWIADNYIGDPVATSEYSVEELKKQGIVGIYAAQESTETPN